MELRLKRPRWVPLEEVPSREVGEPIDKRARVADPSSVGGNTFLYFFKKILVNIQLNRKHYFSYLGAREASEKVVGKYSNKGNPKVLHLLGRAVQGANLGLLEASQASSS